MSTVRPPAPEAAAHPSMVALLREARGWTQGELAGRANLSQGTISKVEAGLQDLRDGRLVAVADALDCPPGLLVDDAPIRGIEVTCLHHRRRGSRINVSGKKQIEATTHLVRVSIEGLLDDVELAADLPLPRPTPLDDWNWNSESASRTRGEHDPAPAVLPNADVADASGASPVSPVDDAGTRAAVKLRETWALPEGPIEDLVELLERAGVIIHLRSLGSAAQDAVSSWPPGRVPVMVVNSGLPGDRQRFTIAHELGHLMMHTVPSENQEDEANHFAGELLAPAEQIAPELDGLTTRDFPKLVQLKAKWGLSVAALIRRAKDIAVVSDRQYREFQVRLNRLGWNPVEPGTLEGEKPALLDKIIAAHLSVPGATMADVAATAHMNEQAFLRLFASHHDPSREQRPRLKVSTTRG